MDDALDVLAEPDDSSFATGKLRRGQYLNVLAQRGDGWLAIEPAKRDQNQKNRLRDYYRVNVNPEYRALSNAATLAKKSADDFESGTISS